MSHKLKQLAATVAALAGALMIQSACQSQPAQIPELVIKAAEYRFDMPDQVEAGLVTLKLQNVGSQAHAAQLARLNDGVTQEQFMAALQQDEMSALSLVVPSGGIDTLPAGASAQVVLDLVQGNYLILSMSGDEVPDVAQGMLKSFEVVARNSQAAAPEPKFDVAVELSDFAFETPAEVNAGPLTWKLSNTGQQPHEMSIARLAPGKTLDDLMAYMHTFEGEPPAEEVTHVGGIAPGQRLWQSIDLQPGDYILICFFPDAASGQPHAALGMVQPFSVK